MTTGELKKLYTIEDFTGIDTKEKYYVLPAEMSAIDAIKLVADKLHISKDKVLETKGYVKDNQLFLCDSQTIIPRGVRMVWAVTRR